MRRLALIALLLAAAALAVVAGASGDSDGGYEVRAIFDNGGFVVSGEDVRIAGATVGSIADVDISVPGEPVTADGSDDPGKAVVVLSIDDPGFQDFREDASCLIRPQSLLGEKYVECSPTQPRAPGSAEPPLLPEIPDGQPGAGQHLLPLESNGKQVDLDLVQNIMRLPYADRFRLILNELGAGLAARGEDLAAIVRRADPALRETDAVLAVLAAQNHQLARLATDSDTILGPLARERQHVTGFIVNAGATAAATAERSDDLEAGIQRLPRFLNELRSTMNQLDSFAVQATPVISDLGVAAPSLTRATDALGPFADSAEIALTSLGDAAAASGDNIAASDPVLKDINQLAHASKGPAINAKKLLGSLNRTNGFKRLADFIYNNAGSLNGFDQLGHFLRAELQSTSCVEYRTTPQSGCGANFTGAGSKAKVATPSLGALKTLMDYGVGR
jgi:phospholipid/cholesterol/gamma-HCH transport system substrate-binding protein